MSVASRVKRHVAWRRERLARRVEPVLIPAIRRALPARGCTFRELGRYGHLGNQLFQIAGTIGIASALGARPLFPRTWAYRRFFSLDGSYYASAFAIARCEEGWRRARHLSDFDRRYLQDLAVWNGHEALIWSRLQPADWVVEHVERMYGEYLAEGATSVHVRRGDYVTKNVVVPATFYREQLERLDPPGPVLVFSDDPCWTRKHLGIAGATPVEGNPDWLDLAVMTRCEHHICANSTFSWWGAFLSRDESPILPWFAGRWPHFTRLVAGASWQLIELAQ